MKRLSIRLKITLWFAAALAAVVALTYVAILSVSRQVIEKTVRDSLITAVEENVNEVEFYPDDQDIDFINDISYFARLGSGYLGVDDDFLDQVNGVCTALYSSDGSLVYGENPIAVATADLPFEDSVLRTADSSGVSYYIFDREVTRQGLDGFWLRGVVSKEQGAPQLQNIVRVSLVALPALVLLAVAGGYLIAGRVLRPIKSISRAASEIGEGRDLDRRIDIGPGGDELHQLADSFNGMFSRLEQAFEAQRQFVSDASHELRTPTSVILAQCEHTLSLPKPGEEDCLEALGVVQRQGRRMSRLINDMLDYMRIETRPEAYPVSSLRLSELLDSLLQDLELIAPRGIQLERRLEPGVVLEGNGMLISRLVTNLVGNAYRYGRQDGHVAVSLERRPEGAIIEVEDDGPGIAPEEQQKIFRRFYQSDSSRTGEGAGLGLSMALEIARFHGGGIELQSEEGKGSTFKVFLKNVSR